LLCSSARSPIPASHWGRRGGELSPWELGLAQAVTKNGYPTKEAADELGQGHFPKARWLLHHLASDVWLTC
jgi:hypothetical protein